MSVLAKELQKVEMLRVRWEALKDRFKDEVSDLEKRMSQIKKTIQNSGQSL